MNRNKAFLSSLAFGVLVIAIIAFLVGPEEFVHRLTSVQPVFLIGALVIQGLSLLVLSLRWKWFVDASGYKTEFKGIALISLVGQALNSITPAARWGGEPVRAYLLKKRNGVPLETGMASVVVEKITDVIAFCFITLAAIFYGFYFNTPSHIIVLLIASLVFTFSVVFALFYVSFITRIESEKITRLLDRYRWLTDKVPLIAQYKNRIQQNLSVYYWSVSRIASARDAWTVGVLFSLGYWFLEILRAYVLFMAFGVEASAAVIATAIVLASIVGSIPFLPGGLGVIEGTMIVIYSTSAISPVIGGIVTLIDRLFSYWLVILLGLPMAWYLGVASRGESSVDESGKR